MFDSKQAVQLMEQMNYLVTRLQTVPQLIPIAREIFAPVLNGNAAPTPSPKSSVAVIVKPRRKISAARRKQMSRDAKARWRKAKKAGKNTIGGAD